MNRKFVFIVILVVLLSGVAISVYFKKTREVPRVETISLDGVLNFRPKDLCFINMYKDKLLISTKKNIGATNSYIYIYNLSSRKTIDIIEVDGAVISLPSMSENFVVWCSSSDMPSASGVYIYNLVKKEKNLIYSNLEMDGEIRNAVMSNRTIVWEFYRYADENKFVLCPPDIYGYDLVTEEKFPIPSEAEFKTNIRMAPKIYGNTVIWEDGQRGGICGYNLATKEGFVLPRHADKNYMEIWEDKIVYASDGVLFYYNITTKKELKFGSIETTSAIDLWGSKIVWSKVEESSDISGGETWLYDLSTGNKKLLWEKRGPKPEGFYHFYPVMYICMYDSTVVWIGGGVSPEGVIPTDLYCIRLG
jgi:hypothetical protein